MPTSLRYRSAAPPWISGGTVGGVATVSDEELTALALAADPDAALPADALSVWDVLGTDIDRQLLPAWYMPAPAPGQRRLTGWRRRAVFVVVAAFVAINAAGLCSTYGIIELA